jgi:NADH-quinone oxidoreductase subunit K
VENLLMPVTPVHYLVLSALLFAMGAAGLLARRNLFTALMSLELMLNAANLAFVTFARIRGDETGQLAALIVVAVAAAEICVGLALVIALFRLRETVDLDAYNDLIG